MTAPARGDGHRRLYRALLRIFPRAFRERNEREMERLFGETLTEWREERGAPRVRFWVAVGWDTLRAAAAEWRMALGWDERPRTARAGGNGMRSIGGDLRFALRQVARHPGHGVTVVLLMTLGVAGNAAVFRVFDGLLLKPLPFEEPDRLVDLDQTAPEWNLEYVGMAYPDFLAWRADNRSFESMAAYGRDGANLSGEGTAERVEMVMATYDLDDVLRLEPELGRFFTAEEDRPDAPRVALLTHGFWERRYASDPTVIGRTLDLDGEPHEIVGVMPARAAFVAEADLWLPLREDPDSNSGWYLTGIGRLREGVTLEQAGADLLAVHRALVDEGRTVNEITSPVLHTLRERYLGDYRASSWFLMGAVGVVLLIACANIAGLMFVRSLSRGHEIGVRLAMGARRGRVVRQLLTESALLAAVGAACGAVAGVWGSGLLVDRLAQQLPSWVTFELDVRFLAFTVSVTAAAVLLFGLAPALHAAFGPGVALAGMGRTTRSLGHRRALSALVVAEVALAVSLLTLGGLSMLDAHRVGRIDPGFATEGVSIWRLQLPATRYTNASARLAFADRYLEDLRALPGVVAATVASSLPLSGHWGWFFEVEDAPPRPEGEGNPVVLMRSVAPGYFETMGVDLRTGRAFDDFDGRDGGARVVIVNETFVRTFMGDGRDPVGRRIKTGGDDDPWLTVVGVAGDVKHYGLDEPVRPGVYQPIRQVPLATFLVAVRTAPEAPSPLPAVRSLTARLDPELPIFEERTLSAVLDDSLWARRATAWVIAAFSTVALVLAVAGLYGVISYMVGQRSREIGVRMAMGARAAQVRAQVVRQGMAVVMVGMATGVAATLALGGLVARLLSQVRPTEPAVYLAVCLLLATVAAVANLLPAARAAATDPMRVLRSE